MKRFFVNFPLQVGMKYKIEGIEHNHIKNVMRLCVNDEIIMVCGDDFDYKTRIIKFSKGDTLVEVFEKQENCYNSKTNVTVFQALVKSDNMSLIIQKLTELGINSFVPFESEFITSKDKFGKSSKLQEVSNQSIKQCKRSKPMIVSDILSFDKMIKKLSEYDVIIFANECEKTRSLGELNLNSEQKIAIIVGSEGGFSTNEIDKIKNAGGNSISLGKRILRAETCAISLSAVVMYLIGEWQYD